MRNQSQAAYPTRSHVVNNSSLRESYEILRNFDSKIDEIEMTSCSFFNFGVKLMMELFSIEELIAPNVNVLGQAMGGSREQRIALDPDRINYIKELVKRKYYNDVSPKEQINNWQKVKDAMNKKLSALRKSNPLNF